MTMNDEPFPGDDPEFNRWYQRYIIDNGHWIEGIIYRLYDAWLAGKRSK